MYYQSFPKGRTLLDLFVLSSVSPQAREDIILLMKSDRTRPETLEAHYGSSAPTRALQALQRDGLLLSNTNSKQDVYEKPMAEVSRDAGGRKPASAVVDPQ